MVYTSDPEKWKRERGMNAIYALEGPTSWVGQTFLSNKVHRNFQLRKDSTQELLNTVYICLVSSGWHLWTRSRSACKTMCPLFETLVTYTWSVGNRKMRERTGATPSGNNFPPELYASLFVSSEHPPPCKLAVFVRRAVGILCIRGIHYTRLFRHRVLPAHFILRLEAGKMRSRNDSFLLCDAAGRNISIVGVEWQFSQEFCTPIALLQLNMPHVGAELDVQKIK